MTHWTERTEARNWFCRECGRVERDLLMPVDWYRVQRVKPDGQHSLYRVGLFCSVTCVGRWVADQRER